MQQEQFLLPGISKWMASNMQASVKRAQNDMYQNPRSRSSTNKFIFFGRPLSDRGTLSDGCQSKGVGVSGHGRKRGTPMTCGVRYDGFCGSLFWKDTSLFSRSSGKRGSCNLLPYGCNSNSFSFSLIAILS